MTGTVAREASAPTERRRFSQRPTSARSVVSARSVTPSGGRSDVTQMSARTHLPQETPTFRGSFGDTHLSLGSTKSAPRRPRSGVGRSTGFTKLIERTVDGLCVGAGPGAYDDVQKVLAHIRKQFDDVHFEAERKENDLIELRKQVKVLEMMEEGEHHSIMSKLTREEMEQKLADVSLELQDAQCNSKVYRHMIERLKLERNVMKEKLAVLQEHADRKRREAVKQRDASRRAQAAKEKKMHELQETEAEISEERLACNQAVDDLEDMLDQREKDIQRREDFERWRYEVAMEAASEAFQSIAGRYQKIYTIEKLTGNCLQKIIFEQAEQSQATEDGFQKIREVTGLTDVMDIVHKFLNRDVEHEQLLQSVRETERKLEALHEERAKRARLATPTEAELEVDTKVPVSLTIVRSEEEQRLAKAKQDLEAWKKKVQQGRNVFDAVCQWGRRMHSFIAPFDNIESLDDEADLAPFFSSLTQAIDGLLAKARTDVPAAKLSKLTSQAHAKEKVEQQKLLSDKDFIRVNCRVPATLEGPGHHRRHHSKGHAEDDDAQGAVVQERQRIKQESMQKVHENSPKVWRRRRQREVVPEVQDALDKVDEQALKVVA